VFINGIVIQKTPEEGRGERLGDINKISNEATLIIAREILYFRERKKS